VLIVGVTVARIELGSGWGTLPLLVVGPAVAAAIGGSFYTLAAGLLAMASALHFVLTMSRTEEGHRAAVVTLVAAAGVTIAGILAGRVRTRRDRQLAEIQLVAESAQRVVLHPVPRRAGPVRLAVRYLSASSGARIGGDLYDVASMPNRVRMIVGDVEGKGLAAVQVAAAALGSFREAAFEEDCLAGVVSRIEASLSRQFPDQQDQQFVTAVFAEISADEQKMELISCGHPAPLLLSPGEGPQPAGPEAGGLPLGLGSLVKAPRISETIPFAPGDSVLFYTDGVSEARDKAGEFFPLTQCTAIKDSGDPASLVDRLSQEVIRHVGHEPDDDIALLAVRRVAA
jgi:serine phosphatase RsbU (regulator of sigma subunit)